MQRLKANDKDRSRSDVLKMLQSRMNGQDGRKYEGKPIIVYLIAVICKCDDIDKNALYRKYPRSHHLVRKSPSYFDKIESRC